MKIRFSLLIALLFFANATAQEGASVANPKHQGAEMKFYMARLVGEMVKIAEQKTTFEGGLSSEIYVRFRIDTAGVVVAREFLDSLSEGADFRKSAPVTPATKELLIQASENLGNFTPAQRDGRNISFNQTMRLRFPVEKFASRLAIEPLLFMGEVPEVSFHPWMRKRVRFDERFLAKGIEGVVHVKFYIEPDGRITSIEVLKTPNAKLSKEVVRVIKNSAERWTPRKVRGVAQRTSYVYRVNYNIN